MERLKLNSSYRVCPGISFRYEAFGGIVYRRDLDKLHFLKSRLAIDLLGLAGSGTVQEIAGILASEHYAEREILGILRSLEELGVIYVTTE